MKYFLYIRGNPGVGKITIARLVKKQLGWRIFWFHDLKNAVYDIVKVHRIPRLMDEVTVPVAKFLLEAGENIIYVRPSPDKETVKTIKQLVEKYPEYTFVPIRLTASYDTLLKRVEERKDEYRISNKKDLDDYLGSRETANIEGEIIIDTDKATPEEVARQIVERVSEK